MGAATEYSNVEPRAETPARLVFRRPTLKIIRATTGMALVAALLIGGVLMLPMARESGWWRTGRWGEAIAVAGYGVMLQALIVWVFKYLGMVRRVELRPDGIAVIRIGNRAFVDWVSISEVRIHERNSLPEPGREASALALLLDGDRRIEIDASIRGFEDLTRLIIRGGALARGVPVYDAASERTRKTVRIRTVLGWRRFGGLMTMFVALQLFAPMSWTWLLTLTCGSILYLVSSFNIYAIGYENRRLRLIRPRDWETAPLERFEPNAYSTPA